MHLQWLNCKEIVGNCNFIKWERGGAGCRHTCNALTRENFKKYFSELPVECISGNFMKGFHNIQFDKISWLMTIY